MNMLEDWRKAAAICRKYKRLECLETAADLMNVFREDAFVIYACTLDRALRPFICHPSFPDDVVSENGNHFAVLLHEKVFDNLHPNGEALEKWKRNFEFAAINGINTNFTESDLKKWQYEEFLAYLKSCNRTKLGQIKSA